MVTRASCSRSMSASTSNCSRRTPAPSQPSGRPREIVPLRGEGSHPAAVTSLDQCSSSSDPASDEAHQDGHDEMQEHLCRARRTARLHVLEAATHHLLHPDRRPRRHLQPRGLRGDLDFSRSILHCRRVHRAMTIATVLWLACRPPTAERRDPKDGSDAVTPRPAPVPRAQTAATPAPFSVVGRSPLGLVEMVPAGDGSLFVVAGGDRVAGARTGERTLVLDEAWARFSDHHEFIPLAAGGRWPDNAYITGWVADRGPDPWPEVILRKDGEWSVVGIPSKPGYVAYYASYHALTDGRVLAVRVQEPVPRNWDLADDALRRSKVRKENRRPPPAWDLLLGRGPKPPPPATGEVEAVAVLPGGGHAIVILPFEVLRAGPEDSGWTRLPGLGAEFNGSFGGVLAVAPGGQLYVGNCGEHESQLVRWVDTHWEPVDSPNDACILSLAFDSEGSLWIAQNGLHRRRQGGDWEAITITADRFEDIKTSGVRFVLLPDGVLWVQEAEVDGDKLIVTTQPGWTALDLNRRLAPRSG